MAGRRRLESNVAGNREFHFRAGSGPAPDPEFGADSFSALAHAGQAPVSIASRLEHLRIDAAAVIAYQNPQLIEGVLDLDFDALGPGMEERIRQGFPADAVDFVAQDRVQRPGLAVHDHTKPDVLFNSEFLSDTRKRLLEIERTALGG